MSPVQRNLESKEIQIMVLEFISIQSCISSIKNKREYSKTTNTGISKMIIGNGKHILHINDRINLT